MAATSYTAIRVERIGAVGVIRLNRPDHLNAYTARMGHEVDHAIAALDSDEAVRCIVVTGEGRAFCAGADLADDDLPFGNPDGERHIAADYGGEGLRTEFWRLRTPTIAAINGPAVGLGMTLAMQLDLRIVAEDAKLGFVFVRRGMVAELNGHFTLTRQVGLATALDLLLTGRILTGREATELGIAHRAVPRDEVLPTALAIGEDIARHAAPAAVAATRLLLYAAAGYGQGRRAERREGEVFAWLAERADAAEGVASFLERRDPRWSDAKALPDELLAAIRDLDPAQETTP